jgi:hypothetical protein
MSDYHRHNPELAEAIDRIFGVHVTPLPDVEQDYDVEQLERDIETCSEAALTPEDEAYERAAFRWGMDGKGAL